MTKPVKTLKEFSEKNVSESLHTYTEADIKNLIRRASRKINIDYKGRMDSGQWCVVIDGEPCYFKNKRETYQYIRDNYNSKNQE